MPRLVHDILNDVFAGLKQEIFSQTEESLLASLRSIGQDCYLRGDFRFKQTPYGRWINRNTHLLNDDVFDILTSQPSVLDRFGLKKCPQCHYIGSIEKMFGYRKRTNNKNDVLLDKQSYCMLCRRKTARSRCLRPTLDISSFDTARYSFCRADERFVLKKDVHGMYVSLVQEKVSLPPKTEKNVSELFQYRAYLPVLHTKSVLLQNQHLTANQSVHDVYSPLGWFPFFDLEATVAELRHMFIGRYHNGWAVFRFDTGINDGSWLALDGTDRVIVHPAIKGLALWLEDLPKAKRKRTVDKIKPKIYERWKRVFGGERSPQGSVASGRWFSEPLLRPICFIDSENHTSFGFELCSMKFTDIQGILTWVRTGVITQWGIHFQEEDLWSSEQAQSGLFYSQRLKCVPSADTPSLIYKTSNPAFNPAVEQALPSLLSGHNQIETLSPSDITCFKMGSEQVGYAMSGRNLLLSERYCLLIPPNIAFDRTIPGFDIEPYQSQWHKLDGVVSEENQVHLEKLGFHISQETPKITVYSSLADQYVLKNGEYIPVFRQGTGCLRCSGFTVSNESPASILLLDANGNQQQFWLEAGNDWKIDLSQVVTGQYILTVMTETTKIDLAYFAFIIQDEIMIDPPLSTMSLQMRTRSLQEANIDTAIDFYDREVIREQLSNMLCDHSSMVGLENDHSTQQAVVFGPPYWKISILIHDIATANREYQYLNLDKQGIFNFEQCRDLFLQYKNKDILVTLTAEPFGSITIRQYMTIPTYTLLDWEKRVQDLVNIKLNDDPSAVIVKQFLQQLFYELGYVSVLPFKPLYDDNIKIGDMFTLQDIPFDNPSIMDQNTHLEDVGVVVLVNKISADVASLVTEWVCHHHKRDGFVLLMDHENICRIVKDDYHMPFEYIEFTKLDSISMFKFARHHKRSNTRGEI